MARVDVEVDIDIEDYLDDVSTDSLIEELNLRGYKALKSSLVSKIEITTMHDEMKLEAFMEGFKNKKLQEVQQFFGV